MDQSARRHRRHILALRVLVLLLALLTWGALVGLVPIYSLITWALPVLLFLAVRRAYVKASGSEVSFGPLPDLPEATRKRVESSDRSEAVGRIG